MRASVLRRKWGRWFHIRPIYLGLLFLHLFLRLLNHLLCQLLNQLLSLFRFLSLPGHCILPCCSAISYGQQVGDLADVAVVPAPHLDWIERLPLIYADRHRVFYTRASIQTVGWMSRTPKTLYGKSIQTMTTAATADATSYTGTISMHMGRSSRRTGPTLIRVRGTLGG